MSFANTLWAGETPDEHEGLPLAEVFNIQDLMRVGTTNVVIDEVSAPKIMDLPDGAIPKIFGSFEAFKKAIMSGEPTYDMETNGHLN